MAESRGQPMSSTPSRSPTRSSSVTVDPDRRSQPRARAEKCRIRYLLHHRLRPDCSRPSHMRRAARAAVARGTGMKGVAKGWAWPSISSSGDQQEGTSADQRPGWATSRFALDRVDSAMTTPGRATLNRQKTKGLPDESRRSRSGPTRRDPASREVRSCEDRNLGAARRTVSLTWFSGFQRFERLSGPDGRWR